MPECERFSQRARSERRLVARPQPPRILDEALEPIEVELVLPKLEEIPGARRANPLGAERLAQPRDIDLDGLARARGGLTVPEAVDQPFDRKDVVPLEQEESEERALFARPDRDALAAVLDLERPKYPKVGQTLTVTRSLTGEKPWSNRLSQGSPHDSHQAPSRAAGAARRGRNRLRGGSDCIRRRRP
jgi:hypothetical protein